MPIETQPVDVLLDRIDIFLALFFRVSVVETQIAQARVFGCYGEIETDGFGMADMQITIRLRRETGVHTAAVLTLGQVLCNHMADKI